MTELNRLHGNCEGLFDLNAYCVLTHFQQLTVSSNESMGMMCHFRQTYAAGSISTE